MELDASEKQNCESESHGFVINEFVSRVLYLKLYKTEINFNICYAKQFSNTLIATRFNLLQFFSTVPSFVFPMLLKIIVQC